MAGERILVVEDESAIVDIVCRALRRHGYETESAGDGDAALDKAAKQGIIPKNTAIRKKARAGAALRKATAK